MVVSSWDHISSNFSLSIGNPLTFTRPTQWISCQFILPKSLFLNKDRINSSVLKLHYEFQTKSYSDFWNRCNENSWVKTIKRPICIMPCVQKARLENSFRTLTCASSRQTSIHWPLSKTQFYLIFILFYSKYRENPLLKIMKKVVIFRKDEIQFGQKVSPKISVSKLWQSLFRYKNGLSWYQKVQSQVKKPYIISIGFPTKKQSNL